MKEIKMPNQEMVEINIEKLRKLEKRGRFFISWITQQWNRNF
jgi:hypothetical protein